MTAGVDRCYPGAHRLRRMPLRSSESYYYHQIVSLLIYSKDILLVPVIPVLPMTQITCYDIRHKKHQRKGNE